MKYENYVYTFFKYDWILIYREIKHYNCHYLLTKYTIKHIHAKYKCANLLEKYPAEEEYTNAFETVRICWV